MRRATWERIHAYAKALGADFILTFPPFERRLEAKIGGVGANVDAVGTKLRELAALLKPLTHTETASTDPVSARYHRARSAPRLSG